MVSDNDTDERPALSRRRVIGLLSGTAMAGLAGCASDGDGTDQPTEATDPTGTTDTAGTTEPPGNETTQTSTVGSPTGTPTETPTATPEPEPELPDDPESIVSVDESQVQPVFPGIETTISMTLENPYLGLELQAGEITLDTSEEGFSFGEPTGNTFETLASGGSQTIEWPVTVPEAPGEYTLEITETYSVGEDTADLTSEITVVVAFDSVVSVDASEVQPTYPGETVTVTSTFENPYGITLEGGDVTIEGSADAFDVTATTDPGFDTLESGSTRDGVWEVTVPEATGEYSMTATVTASVGDQGAETTLEIPVTVSSIEQRDDEMFIQQTGGGVPSEPAFTLLPEGDDISEASEVEDENDLSAVFYFGYDTDNLYLRAEVTDDTHVAKSGGDMWQNDNIQYAAGIIDEGTEIYGPEDGISHVEGQAEMWRWFDGNANQDETAVEATTSRDETNSLTTYEATIPWEALFSESKGPGDSFQFSVQVNEADSEGSDRKAVLGWTLPGINQNKSYGELGRFHLEDPDA
jgi:hypothetical protein